MIDLLTRQVNERVRAEEKLQDSNQRLLTAQRLARIGHWELDPGTNTITLSTEASELFGLDSEVQELDREAFMQFVHPDDRTTLAFALLRLTGGDTQRFSIRHRLLLPNGRERHMLAEGEWAKDARERILGIHQDLTERQKTEQTVFNLVHFDTLTGLFNRTGLHTRLHMALHEANPRNESVALLLLDIDRFTAINSTQGHHIGDELLRAFAERLKNALGPRDTVARMAADEFAIILVGVDGTEAACDRARDILGHCKQPLVVDGCPHVATSSLGLSLFPQDAANRETLLRHATGALHQAKDTGGDTLSVYTETRDEKTRHQLRLEQGLRAALHEGQLELHYQPQASLASGHVAGVEALLRWRHPEAGLISPGDFIPLAEKTGLIVPVGTWVLQTATRQLAEWDRNGFPPLRLAINLSARQFADPNLPDRVLETLQASALAPERLELEITESILVEDIDAASAMLQQLVHLGVSVAIDDFGTGQSSLRYLRRLPLTTLKIDREFTWGIGHDPDDEAHRPGDHRSRKDTEASYRGRRGRDPGAIHIPARDGLRRGTGLPARPANARGGTGTAMERNPCLARRFHEFVPISRRIWVSQGNF